MKNPKLTMCTVIRRGGPSGVGKYSDSQQDYLTSWSSSSSFEKEMLHLESSTQKSREAYQTHMREAQIAEIGDGEYVNTGK